MLTIIISLAFMIPAVNAQNAVVNAILFYSPSCPHCHTVIQEVLPPLIDQYGSQLNIIGINVSVQQGQELYQAAVQRFQIPEEKLGVPSLIVGDTVLVGSVEIPDRLPGMIETELAQGGTALPDIPGLQEALAENPENAADKASGSAQLGSAGSDQNSALNLPADQSTLIERFRADLVGNLLSVVVLLGMIGGVISVGISYSGDKKTFLAAWPAWVIPLLAVVGIGISLYMSYVEITQTEALCGPVGNCNAVQQSPYARLFGVLPIGMMGVIGYVLIAVAWLLQKIAPEKWRKSLTLILWGMALVGVLFSIYLTFLEPFVIGATCAWCISSAIVITLIFLAASEPARLALKGTSHRRRG
ncbi:MAG: vitamin K epoxide reductase family protein [Anaerolineales bacterium]